MRLPTVCIVLLTARMTMCQGDNIVFPGTSRTPLTTSSSALGNRQQSSTSPTTPLLTPQTDNITQIPLEEVRRLNEIDSIEEFLEKFGLTDVADSPAYLSTRLGDFGDARNNVESPKPAKCEPEMTTVSLQNTSNNFMLFFPSCTRVLRCGGCCNSDLLSCQPTSVRLRNFQVYASEYTMGRLVPFRRKEAVFVEEHTKCTCDCRIKPEDCNSFQEYRKKDCRCRCINHEDRQKCESDNATKIWDYNSCMCRCRDVSECSTGLYFDENTCSCKPEPVVVRFGQGETESQKRRPTGNRYGYVTSNLGRFSNNRKSRSVGNN